MLVEMPGLRAPIFLHSTAVTQLEAHQVEAVYECHALGPVVLADIDIRVWQHAISIRQASVDAEVPPASTTLGFMTKAQRNHNYVMQMRELEFAWGEHVSPSGRPMHGERVL